MWQRKGTRPGTWDFREPAARVPAPAEYAAAGAFPGASSSRARDPKRVARHPLLRRRGAALRLKAGVPSRGMTGAARPDLPDDAPVRVGDVVEGKYRVDRVLGAGGMGMVVAATHLQLQQTVAIKFLLPSVRNSAEAVERFLREARAAVRLTSPHVARVFDVGTLQDGLPFIVLELFDGEDLDQRLESRKRFTPEDVVAFGVQACAGLAEAHRVGIIHRDLKPANLFLARLHDGTRQLKVLDFGISKMLDPAIVGDTPDLTATNALLGTPHYMSPEQMRSGRGVDARTDVWSLGACLYAFLTGGVPFNGTSMIELGAQVLREDPVAPAAIDPRIPGALSRVVLSCLSKDPNGRPASAEALAEALRSSLVAPMPSATLPAAPPWVPAPTAPPPAPAAGAESTPRLDSHASVAVTTGSTRSRRGPVVAAAAAVSCLVIAVVVVVRSRMANERRALPPPPVVALAPEATGLPPTSAPAPAQSFPASSALPTVPSADVTAAPLPTAKRRRSPAPPTARPPPASSPPSVPNER